MNMQEQEQELLLGYLMNALDRQDSARVERDLLRQPRLRSELAALQQQIAPLDYINDPILPPPFLAEKTCTKIWDIANHTSVDHTSVNHTANGTAASEPVSEFTLEYPSQNTSKNTSKTASQNRTDTMTDTALNTSLHTAADAALKPSQEFALESALIPMRDPFFKPMPQPAGVNISVTETAAGKAAEIVRKPRRTVPWIGLTASVSVGIILAFLAFPMLRRAGRETINYITQTRMDEFNQRVDHFEQIHVKPNPSEGKEESNMFNLATTGWRELPPQTSNYCLSEPPPPPARDIILSAAQPAVPAVKHGTSPAAVIRGQERPFLFEWDYPDIPLSLDARSAGDQILITNPAIKTPLRSAYGQDVLMKDGRIFFRILPGTEKPAKP